MLEVFLNELCCVISLAVDLWLFGIPHLCTPMITAPAFLFFFSVTFCVDTIQWRSNSAYDLIIIEFIGSSNSRQDQIEKIMINLKAKNEPRK